MPFFMKCRYVSYMLINKGILANGQALSNLWVYIGNAARVEFLERYPEILSPDSCHVTVQNIGCPDFLWYAKPPGDSLIHRNVLVITNSQPI
ncbi:hypothetical protein I79_026239 [Cricetulus griseus]|uniref:Uncharacterized protein n=1 Tax=Cricetulus griseus TaxID=10029 RepID=G3IQC5_CRIGR|nr:hypothetical protein I79_026239 [Cricetulus griseus]